MSYLETTANLMSNSGKKFKKIKMEYVLHQTLQKHATLSVCSADHAALTSTNAVTRPPENYAATQNQ